MQIPWKRFPPCGALLTLFTVLAAGGVTSFAEPGAQEPSASHRRDYVDRLTSELRLETADEPRARLQRGEKSVLQWSWERNGFTDGQTFVWGTQGRPHAVGGAFLVPGERVAYYEFVSISPQRLIGRLSDKTVWTPPAADLSWWKVPAAPSPSETARGRLLQLRALSQQFSGVAHMGPPRYEEGTRWELRLLTTPLYRYSDADHEVLDGAMFVMVMGTDPQLVLLLEAQQEEDKATWKAAFAPLSGFELTASFRAEEIWRSPKAENGHAKNSIWHLSHPLDASELFAAETK